LEGPDERRQITRDREVIFSDLSPGDHVFRVRAFTGEAPSEEEWSTIRFTIRPPIWARAWFILLSLAVAITFFVLLLRARDKRLRERERIEREKVRFQLDALRSQVDPHFLFNSFNTLVELIETDADIAVAHVEKLSLFFRNILQVRDKELITVDEELGLLANYFALEQHRFGEAISMEVTVSDDAREKYIVPLTLQLLVENAIKHNIATIQRPLHISVASAEEDIVVTNPVQERLTSPRSMGFGLDSIRKRYKALSERPIRMERTEERFIVAIPLITHAP
jgi:LytS/YehU family sensor histidine kinase